MEEGKVLFSTLRGWDRRCMYVFIRTHENATALCVCVCVNASLVSWFVFLLWKIR